MKKTKKNKLKGQGVQSCKKVWKAQGAGPNSKAHQFLTLELGLCFAKLVAERKNYGPKKGSGPSTHVEGGNANIFTFIFKKMNGRTRASRPNLIQLEPPSSVVPEVAPSGGGKLNTKKHIASESFQQSPFESKINFP